MAEVPYSAILSAPTLVITHPTKAEAVHPEYGIFTADHRRIGTVRNGGGPKPTPLRNALGLDRRHLQVLDADGALVLVITRALTLVKFRAIVHDARGHELGRITQQNVGFVTEPRIELESGGNSLGVVIVRSGRSWGLRIVDALGAEIARASVSRSGLIARSDTYVVDFTWPFTEPLHSLRVAVAIATIELRLRGTADAQATKKVAKQLKRDARWGGE